MKCSAINNSSLYRFVEKVRIEIVELAQINPVYWGFQFDKYP